MRASMFPGDGKSRDAMSAAAALLPFLRRRAASKRRQATVPATAIPGTVRNRAIAVLG